MICLVGEYKRPERAQAARARLDVEIRPLRKQLPTVLHALACRSTLRNGHQVRQTGPSRWQCSECRIVRGCCRPRAWKRECCRWHVREFQPSPSLAVSGGCGQAAGLDDPKVDQDLLDHVIADDARGEDLHGEASIPCSSDGPWPGGAMVGPAHQRARRLPVIDSRVCFASCKIHTSHRIRFTSAYLWCMRCAGFTSGGTAKLLFSVCRGSLTNRTAEHYHRRLSGGLTLSAKHVQPDGVHGQGTVEVHNEHGAAYALQVYSSMSVGSPLMMCILAA